MSAVSISVTPASSAASSTANDCSYSIRPPKLFVPRPTTETSGPPSPRRRVRMSPTLLEAPHTMARRGASLRLPRRAAPQRHDTTRAAARRASRDQRLLGDGRARGRGPASPERLSRGEGVRRSRAVRLRARVAPHRELAARLGGERAEAVRGVVAALGPLPPAAAREVAAEPAQDALPAGALPGLGVRRRRPPPDSGLDPDREMARHATLRPAVRALAPLPRAVRRRPRAPRPGARPHLRATRPRPGRRAARDLRVPGARAHRAERACRGRGEREVLRAVAGPEARRADARLPRSRLALVRTWRAALRLQPAVPGRTVD